MYNTLQLKPDTQAHGLANNYMQYIPGCKEVGCVWEIVGLEIVVQSPFHGTAPPMDFKRFS